MNSENSPLRLDKDKTRLVPAEEEDEYDEESELKERKTE